MTEYQAHITEQWERNTLTIQVRALTDTGHTMALGQMLEDHDGVAFMHFRPLTPEQQTGQADLDPTPGFRLPWEVAVAVAQAVIAHTQAPADPGEVQALKDTVDALASDLRERDAELAAVTAERNQWEVLALAKDELNEAVRNHLEREAETANLERRRLERQEIPVHLIDLQDRVNTTLENLARHGQAGE